MRLSPLPLLLVIAGGLAAAEGDHVDILLSLGRAPGIDSWKGEATEVFSGTELEDEVDFDAQDSIAIEVMGRYTRLNASGIGLAGSIGAFYRDHRGEQTFDGFTNELQARAFGVALGADLAWSPIQHLMITAGPRLGLGGASLNDNDPLYEDGTGYYVSYGAQAGISYAIAGRVIVGLDAGWMGFQAGASQAYDDGDTSGDVTTTYSGSGLAANVTLGMRL